MFARSFAILLAVLGLCLCAVDAGAQPRGWVHGGGDRSGWGRGGGGWGRGGWGGGRGFGGPARFSGPPSGFRAGGYREGFGPGRGEFGGEPRDFAGPRNFGAPADGPPRIMAGPRPGGFDGDWRGEQDEVRRAVREGRHVPLGQAIQAVRRRAPGRELDAGLEPGPNGRPVYRLRWAGQNGRRQDFMVDAETGAVLGVQGGP